MYHVLVWYDIIPILVHDIGMLLKEGCCNVDISPPVASAGSLAANIIVILSN